MFLWVSLIDICFFGGSDSTIVHNRSLLRVCFQLKGLFCRSLWIVMCNGDIALFVGLFATRFSGSLSFDISLFC